MLVTYLETKSSSSFCLIPSKTDPVDLWPTQVFPVCRHSHPVAVGADVAGRAAGRHGAVSSCVLRDGAGSG